MTAYVTIQLVQFVDDTTLEGLVTNSDESEYHHDLIDLIEVRAENEDSCPIVIILLLTVFLHSQYVYGSAASASARGAGLTEW